MPVAGQIKCMHETWKVETRKYQPAIRIKKRKLNNNRELSTVRRQSLKVQSGLTEDSSIIMYKFSRGDTPTESEHTADRQMPDLS